MGYNPTTDHGANAFKTDNTQQSIAGLQNEYWRAILGDDTVREQDQLRHEMGTMMALLGEVRVRAQEVVKEYQAELEARKGLFELAKA